MAIYELKFENEKYELCYEIINLDKEKILMILHGWGASKDIMKQAFSDKFKDFKQIYIDLPGFAKSNIKKDLDSFEYAQILSKFIREKDLKINTVMGHSFGGKLSALLCKEFNIKNIILLSSAGILWKKNLKTRLKIKIFKILKLLGFSSFYRFFASKDVKGMNELMYKTFKRVVDEDFSSIFSSLKSNALIFWGKDDNATPLKSGEKIHNLIQNSKFYALNGDHFFFLKESENINKICEKELK